MSEVLHSVGLYGKVWNTLFISLALQLVETSLVAQIQESACNMGDPGLIPGREDPLEKGVATHSSILA